MKKNALSRIGDVANVQIEIITLKTVKFTGAALNAPIVAKDILRIVKNVRNLLNGKE